MSDFPIGTRVFSSAVGQSGTVLKVYSSGVVAVRFPTGERTVPFDSLRLELTDPFELLALGRFSEDPEWYEIKLRAARLRAAYGSDDLSGLVNSRVILRPHQIFVAHRILDKARPSMILADEVGLGKTVEAGLVLKELLARQSVSRVLIAVPPGLINQWHTELRIKFNETFDIVDRPLLARTRQLFPERNPWTRFDRALVSSHFVRGEDVREELADAGWDLVILDEAHHCRRRMEGNSEHSTELYKTIELLKDSAFGVLLLTATPMQLHPYELFSLVEIVEPGLYSGYAEFESEVFESQEARNAIKALQEWDEASHAARSSTSAFLSLSKLATDLSNPVERENSIDALLSNVHLTDAIIRNRKRTVGGFMRRQAQTRQVTMTSEEAAAYASLTSYLRRGFATAAAKNDRILGFEMVAFQRMFASSGRAAANALANRRSRLLKNQRLHEEMTDATEEPPESTSLALADLKEEVAALEPLIAQLAEAPDSKVEYLVPLISGILERDPNEKVLIFTQYYATQELIASRLAQFRVVQFNGRMDRWKKDAAVEEFRRTAQVMIATEAGGEGRNFQFCHILVNYDLHWNPMRIEQRIGRLDRYGQTRNVHIYNLALIGTIEDRLVSVITNRLKMFEVAVGALELVLGDLEDELQLAIFESQGDIDSAARRFERAVELRLADAKRVEEQAADFLIEIRSFRQDAANRLTEQLREGRVKVDLEALVLQMLSRFPTATIERDEEIYRIGVPPALPRSLGVSLEESYEGTFSAADAVNDESLEFFGFGHPLVDACFLYAEQDIASGLTSVRQMPVGRISEPAIEVNYLLEFSGVRKWARIHTLVFDLSGKRRPDLEGQTSLAEPSDEVPPRLDDKVVSQIENAAVEAMVDIALREQPSVVALNRRRADDEALRASRIHRYNLKRIDQRVAAQQETIARVEADGTPEQQRILPALRGRIESLGRELQVLEAELAVKQRDIEQKAVVTESYSKISLAVLLP